MTIMRTPRAGMSRRRFLGATASAGMAAAAGSLPVVVGEAALAQGAPTVAGPGAAAPDLTLVNGRIYTMNAGNTVASTATIRNGRVAIVGDAAPPAGTQVIDLRG